MFDIQELTEKIEAFCPVEFTEELVNASMALDTAEHNLKLERAKRWVIEKNSEGKPTDKLVEAKIDTDPDIIKLEIDRIKAQGKYLSSKLKRDDLYEKHNANKKIADLNKVGY